MKFFFAAFETDCRRAKKKKKPKNQNGGRLTREDLSAPRRQRAPPIPRLFHHFNLIIIFNNSAGFRKSKDRQSSPSASRPSRPPGNRKSRTTTNFEQLNYFPSIIPSRFRDGLMTLFFTIRTILPKAAFRPLLLGCWLRHHTTPVADPGPMGKRSPAGRVIWPRQVLSRRQSRRHALLTCFKFNQIGRSGGRQKKHRHHLPVISPAPIEYSSKTIFFSVSGRLKTRFPFPPPVFPPPAIFPLSRKPFPPPVSHLICPPSLFLWRAAGATRNGSYLFECQAAGPWIELFVAGYGRPRPVYGFVKTTIPKKESQRLSPSLYRQSRPPGRMKYKFRRQSQSLFFPKRRSAPAPVSPPERVDDRRNIVYNIQDL